MLASLWRDARMALRQLANAKVFSLVAVLTIGLAIGATSAIFGVVNGVLLRPLPYPDPDALVRVHELVPQYGRFSVAPGTFLDWRAQSDSFTRLGAYASTSVTLVSESGPERIPGASVSHGLFEALGARPSLGRTFTSDEDLPGAPGVVVLSHGAWQGRFGSDPGVVGRSLVLSERPHTVIGVMPEGFYFPTRGAELWTPLALDPAQASRGAHFLGVVARLAPGVSPAQADAGMKTIAARLAQQYPDTNAGESAEVVRLHEQVVGRVRPALWTLFAAVLVVVLIACANVANLLLVRAQAREREIAIRTALGASRSRIAGQLMVESLAIGLLGGALGLLLARLALPAIQALAAGQLPRVEDVAIDPRVLGFAALVSLVTGLVFGLAPVWQAFRGGSSQALREGGRGATAAAGRLRGALLVGEVALSLVLLVGAALLLRSFARLTSVDPGFEASRVLAFEVALPRATYAEDHQRVRLFSDLLQRLAALPGARSAGMVQTLPMRGGYVLTFAVDGRPPAKPGEEPSARHRSVSPGYFETLAIPLRRGRAFDERDVATSKMVAVVDQAFAERHFPGEDPLGRGLDIGNGSDGFYEIVGVVGNVRHDGLDEAPAPTMYVPYAQDVFSSMWLVVRADGRPPTALAAAAREALRGLDPALPAARLGPLQQAVSDSVAERRFSMLLLGLFALVALFLAAVGLYGVVAYAVAQRTREIGLRVAIGAEARDVLRLVLASGLRLALLGVAIGIPAALLLSRVLASMLYEVTPFDPLSYAGTALVLLAVAAVACAVPAARAARVDPVVALRQE